MSTEQRIKLNLGCGIGLLGGFINVDKYFAEEQIRNGYETKQGPCQLAEVEPGATYVQADILTLPFPDDYADYVLLSEVLEHFSMREVFPALCEIRRVLKPQGVLTITTPDFNGICRQWLGTVGSQVGTFRDWDLYRWMAETAYGNQAGPGEFHRCPITPDYLNVMLLGAGFVNIVITIHPAGGPPALGYDGCRYKGDQQVRSDEIFATAIKKPVAEQTPDTAIAESEPDTAPPPLGVSVGERVATKDGLK